MRGASAADGYWNQRQKEPHHFRGGKWTCAGDKYERAGDGRYIYCGRTDDMFKVSGIWVSPFEVEQALVAHPAILEAAVVAAADAEGLEKPKAFIVMKDAKESLNQDVLCGICEGEDRQMEIPPLGRNCGGFAQNRNAAKSNGLS